MVCGKKNFEICPACVKNLPNAPLRCLKCSKANPYGVYCNSCFKKSKPDAVLARLAFRGPARELIHSFKYEDVFSLSGVFSRELKKIIIKTPNCRRYTVSSIPLSAKKLRQRGYNQSKLIAEAISMDLNLVFSDILTRVDGNFSQVQSGNKISRKNNVKGVFKLNQNRNIPKNIILVDDVVTTGATVEEATKVLKKAGAKKVIVLAVALA